MDLTTNGVVITDAIKHVQGKMEHLNTREKKILQDIKENNAKNEDIDLQETNNDILAVIHRIYDLCYSHGCTIFD